MYPWDLAKLVRPPFSDLFPPDPLVLDAVVEAMTTYGYDQSQPVLVWEEGQALMDGHTRLKAAVQAGIEDVPVHYKSFDTEDEVLVYAIHLQKNRRNLTDAEIFRCIAALDRRRTQGRDNEGRFTGASNEASGKSAQETAKMVGISRAKVERVRTVLEHAEEPVREAVTAGELSINRAYQITQEQRKPEAAGPPPPEEDYDPDADPDPVCRYCRNFDADREVCWRHRHAVYLSDSETCYDWRHYADDEEEEEAEDRKIVLATLHTGDQESYTPARYIEAAREVMGSIDLDSASNEQAQEIVQAKVFYTKEDNGLDNPWEGNIFLNPPYSHPEIKHFVDNLLAELKPGQQAILLTNNNTDTTFFHNERGSPAPAPG
jgi:hypothetical protein